MGKIVIFGRAEVHRRKGRIEKVKEGISGDAAVPGSTLGWEIQQKQLYSCMFVFKN